MFYRGKFFTKKEVLNCCYCCTETECIFESKCDLRDLFWSVQYSEESRENFSQTRLESLRSIVRVMLIKCQVGTFLIWIWLWSAADGCLASPLIVLLADECIEAFEELWLTVFLDFSHSISLTDSITRIVFTVGTSGENDEENALFTREFRRHVCYGCT